MTQVFETFLWRRALLWLLFLGSFFFTSYGFANWLASQQSNIGSIVFEWEKQIHFMAWTIIPYWLIDLFYAISFFVCTRKLELDRHAFRLLTAQIIAVACFIVFPLAFSFDRPASDGLSGAMFETLKSFDKPFNQAPSLHITLLVILWALYIRHLPKILLWPCHVIALMIVISVLTTYQHHFFDIPTGFLLGWLCIWIWPLQNDSPLKSLHITRSLQQWRLAVYYSAAALICFILAVYLSASALWLLWPAWSLVLVASCYLFFGAKGFQKASNGKLSLASLWMYYPYLLAVKLNAAIWTRNIDSAHLITNDVWLGRFPGKKELTVNQYSVVIDLTAECNVPNIKTGQLDWYAFPCLDLALPPVENLLQAANKIEQSYQKGRVLVCCALGFSRSALVVISWLVITNRASTVEEAVALVKTARDTIVIKEEDLVIIDEVLRLSTGEALVNTTGELKIESVRVPDE